MEHEKGYSVCQGGRVTALVHNHPSGNINPSKKDMETARQHDVKICVQVNHDGKIQTKCYKPKKVV